MRIHFMSHCSNSPRLTSAATNIKTPINAIFRSSLYWRFTFLFLPAIIIIAVYFCFNSNISPFSCIISPYLIFYYKDVNDMKIRLLPNQMEEIEGLRNDYPYAYHHVDLSSTAIPWHWHEALEFNYIVQGSMKVSTAGRTLTFRKGEGFFINSNVLASMSDLEHCIIDSHLFHPVFLGGHFNSVFETKYLHPVTQSRDIELVPLRGETEQQRKLLYLLRQLAALQQTEDTHMQTRNLLSDIWLLLLEELRSNQPSPSTADSRSKDRLLTMIAFIQEHHADKLTLEQIAASAAVSTRECLRCFRRAIGQSPTEYLIGYRIEKAKKLLQTTELPITQIALQTGFASPAYFSKTFRAHTGEAPNMYRARQHRS